MKRSFDTLHALLPTLTLEQERRVSERRSQFIALASHELRPPMAGIHSVTTTLRERGNELQQEQVELLQQTLYE
jgi:signal transduction histidine kinase